MATASLKRAFCILPALPITLESPLPPALPAGSSVALYCSGRATVGEERVRGMDLLVDGLAQEVRAAAMPRFDLPARRSGFWAVVPVHAAPASGSVSLAAEVRGRSPGTERAEIGRIEVSPAEPPAEHNPGDEPLIAVCLGTYNPDRALLRAQLQSLREQTDRRWMCVISDDHSSPEHYALIQELVDGDARFTVSRAQERIGFYRNFERALELAPREAGLIALCDQDDVWHPEKLALLRRALGPAGLVYCDQRLVDRRGTVLRETMWRGRSNNHTNLASMLMANTITGAASLMRRRVVDLALPFPDSPGIEFHDHWLGLVALASGEVRYLDRVLYDYVQHEEAILGKVSRRPSGGSRPGLPRMREWRAAYFLGYVPGQVRAGTLLLRCQDRLTGPKRRALERYVSAESSALAFGWLLIRPLRQLLGRTETLGTEWELARGVAWRWLAGTLARVPRLPDRFLLDCAFPNPPHYEHRRLQRWRSQL